MKKGAGSASTIIIGSSKSVLVYEFHNLEYVLGLARFQVFVLKLLLLSASNGSSKIVHQKAKPILTNSYIEAFVLAKRRARTDWQSS